MIASFLWLSKLSTSSREPSSQYLEKITYGKWIYGVSFHTVFTYLRVYFVAVINSRSVFKDENSVADCNIRSVDFRVLASLQPSTSVLSRSLTIHRLSLSLSLSNPLRIALISP